jgi:hypothetical protein
VHYHPPMATLFDTNDEINLASVCVANCRQKTRCTLYCAIAVISCLIIGGLCKSVEWLFVSLALFLPLPGIYFAIGAFFHGVDYFLKFRHIKQGWFSIIGDTAFNVLWLLLIAAAFAVPSISGGAKPALHMRTVADINHAGVMLSAYANEHDGKYPDDLAGFIKTEVTDRRLFYKKDGRQLRWILTPGLTTNSPSRTVLLQSVEKVKADNSEYLIVYTIGNSAEAIKNPGRNIVIFNGKPMLREK